MVAKLLLIINFLLSVSGRVEITPGERKVDLSDQTTHCIYSCGENNHKAFSINEENLDKSGDRVENISVFPVTSDLNSRNGSFLNIQIAAYSRKEHSYCSCIKTVESATINKSPLIKSLRI